MESKYKHDTNYNTAKEIIESSSMHKNNGNSERLSYRYQVDNIYHQYRDEDIR